MKKQISHGKDTCEGKLKTPSMFISLHHKGNFVFLLAHYLKTEGRGMHLAHRAWFHSRQKVQQKQRMGFCKRISEKETLTITMCFTHCWGRKAIPGLRQASHILCAFPAEPLRPQHGKELQMQPPLHFGRSSPKANGNSFNV